MKVLFLDHDGVICLSDCWGSRFKNKEGLDSIFDRFDEKSIKVLNSIIEKTDCEIVISSDWRFFATLEQMQELYKNRGVIKSPIGYTTTKRLDKSEFDYDGGFIHLRDHEGEQTRSLEIKKWLREHPDVTNWVAVDDMNMSNKYHFSWDSHRENWGLSNFVYTPISTEGIKQSGVKNKIVKYLVSSEK